METKAKKYWPDAKVSDGAEYIGGYLSTAPYDIYLNGTNLDVVNKGNVIASHPIEDVFAYAKGGSEWAVRLNAVLAAHRARTPAPSAPAAMSRSEMIQKAAKAGWAQRDTGTSLEGPYRDEWYAEYEAALDAIGVLPPPPPPQKSVNEQVAEGMVKRSDGGDVLCTHPTDKDRALLLRHISLSSENTVISLREYIAAALDARDAEHRQAMGQKDWDMRAELTELREECATLAKGHSSADFIRRLPLTIAERSAARGNP